MPKAIVLHAGFHKTGTSTIQQSLRANRPILKRHVAIRLKPMMKELLHAARGFSTWRDPISLAKAEMRFGALLDDLPRMPRRTLCLSAEELCGHMPGRGALRDYSAAPLLLSRFCETARARFPNADLSIALTVRTQQDWLRSAWAEHVKSSSMVLDFDAYVENYAESADLPGMAEQIADATGVRVNVIAMEDHARNLVAPLLRHCGVPSDVLEQVQPVRAANTRLPEAVLLELLQANRAHADKANRTKAKRAILAGISK